METALQQEQQYQRDKARLAAHKLALKDDEFNRVSELVRQEARDQARHHQERGAGIILQDRDSRVLYVSTTDGQQVVTITFNAVRYEIEVKKVGGTLPVLYLFSVDIATPTDKPIIIGTKWKTEPLGVVSDETVMSVIRKAINALLAT
jgi:hypothetical protein